jgi:hypothetical protein
LASLAPFFVGFCCRNLLGLGSSAGFVVVGVEVGKFLDILLVKILCKFK